MAWLCELEWSGVWNTSTIGWLGAIERDRYLEGSPAMNTKCLVPLPFLPDLKLSIEPFSWLIGVGTTWNTIIRLRWSRIGLAVIILHAAGVCLTGRPVVISGRHNECHWLQLQNHYTHSPSLQHTHTSMQTQLCGIGHGKWSWVSRHSMLALEGGILCDRKKRHIGH